jgi:hypothetical protein
MSGMRAALRHKVEQRRKELQRAFSLAKRAGPPAHRTSLETELSLVDYAMRGGWDHVSEVAADALSHWLETTRSLLA